MHVYNYHILKSHFIVVITHKCQLTRHESIQLTLGIPWNGYNLKKNISMLNFVSKYNSYISLQTWAPDCQQHPLKETRRHTSYVQVRIADPDILDDMPVTNMSDLFDPISYHKLEHERGLEVIWDCRWIHLKFKIFFRLRGRKLIIYHY